MTFCAAQIAKSSGLGLFLEPASSFTFVMAVYRTKLDTRNACFWKNNYNADFIELNTHRNSEPDKTTNNSTPVTTTTIPYIKGTETVARILQPTTRTDQRQGQNPTSR